LIGGWQVFSRFVILACTAVLGVAWAQPMVVGHADSTLRYDIAGKPFPHWSGGALVVIEGDGTNNPVFRVLNRYWSEVRSSRARE
jgi:hypothetical protein